jgi:hypothetical protein
MQSYHDVAPKLIIKELNTKLTQLVSGDRKMKTKDQAQQAYESMKSLLLISNAYNNIRQDNCNLTLNTSTNIKTMRSDRVLAIAGVGTSQTVKAAHSRKKGKIPQAPKDTGLSGLGTSTERETFQTPQLMFNHDTPPQKSKQSDKEFTSGTAAAFTTV